MRRRWRGARGRSAYDVTWANSERGYERLWGTPAFVAEYLDPVRLAFYEEIAQLCDALEPTSVIDVGCGGGDLLLRVTRDSEDIRAVGVDSARSAVNRAQELVPQGRFFAGDATQLELDETFDLVLCTEVLEHVRDPAAILDALERFCGSDGTIVITVPDGAIDTFEGHSQFWTEAELAALLEPRGLREIRRIGPVEPCPTLVAIVAPPR
jgi:2-polyprenyl-3-methyl-5-hydroxy-6-metoxy-1,4-benzoquinol methylase